MSSNCIWTIVILYYDCVWIEQIVFDCELCSRSYKYEICYFVLLVWLSVLSQVARWLYWPKWPDRPNWPDWPNWPIGPTGQLACLFYWLPKVYMPIVEMPRVSMPMLEMYQWSHLAILGRENSSTSGEAASGGILKFSMSHERHIPIPVQVTIFPHEWLSRRGEKKILHERRSREWRIFFYHNC